MPRNAKEELEWQSLDLQLDRELESTFPASDALKITRARTAPKQAGIPKSRKIDSVR